MVLRVGRDWVQCPYNNDGIASWLEFSSQGFPNGTLQSRLSFNCPITVP